MNPSRNIATITVALLTALSVVDTARSQQPKPVRIALSKTFLVDQPKSIAEIAADDFVDVLKKTTGLTGELATKYDAAEIAAKLDGKQVDFGIFHAHAFAALQKKHAELRPLLIAGTKGVDEKAYLIVHQKAGAKTILDLKGKKLDLPTGTKEHCRVYLDKRSADAGEKGAAAFFESIKKSESPTEALNEVARGNADATIIDRSSLDFYKEVRGPVFAKNLKILEESEPFPAALIVHRPGTLDDKTVSQFRDGLLKAHLNARGREMMKEWNIDAFEPIPKDYAKKLDAILKAYPPR